MDWHPTNFIMFVVILALRHEWEGQATALLILLHLANRQGQTMVLIMNYLSQIDDVSEPTFHYFP
jgi:hypothetical protein